MPFLHQTAELHYNRCDNATLYAVNV